MLRLLDAVTQKTVEVTPRQEAHGVYRNVSNLNLESHVSYSSTPYLPHETGMGHP
jgi:hypothetical protein